MEVKIIMCMQRKHVLSVFPPWETFVRLRFWIKKKKHVCLCVEPWSEWSRLSLRPVCTRIIHRTRTPWDAGLLSRGYIQVKNNLRNNFHLYDGTLDLAEGRKRGKNDRGVRGGWSDRVEVWHFPWMSVPWRDLRDYWLNICERYTFQRQSKHTWGYNKWLHMTTPLFIAIKVIMNINSLWKTVAQNFRVKLVMFSSSRFIVLCID